MGCVSPKGASVPFPADPPNSSSKSGSSSRAGAGGFDLTTPALTSSSWRYAARAFSAGERASKGDKKRHDPSSSNSTGRSGVLGLRMGGSHFSGEKYDASGSWCGTPGASAGGRVVGAKVWRKRNRARTVRPSRTNRRGKGSPPVGRWKGRLIAIACCLCAKGLKTREYEETALMSIAEGGAFRAPPSASETGVASLKYIDAQVSLEEVAKGGIRGVIGEDRKSEQSQAARRAMPTKQLRKLACIGHVDEKRGRSDVRR